MLHPTILNGIQLWWEKRLNTTCIFVFSVITEQFIESLDL